MIVGNRPPFVYVAVKMFSNQVIRKVPECNNLYSKADYTHLTNIY